MSKLQNQRIFWFTKKIEYVAILLRKTILLSQVIVLDLQ